jgi:predicted RNA binding protein YcfA (HicA-like mRNA interferase family)
VVFPSLKAKQLMKVLRRKPLRYSVVSQRGSHRKLEAEGYPAINFAFHDKDEVPPGLVRQILVQRVGLSEQEALELIK